MFEPYHDILIIGAGVLGCAIAWEISHYALSVAVLDKEGDVACGASGRNSAVVHAGFNNKPGTRMARYCVQGSQGFGQLSSQLGFPYKKTGKLVVALTEDDMPVLRQLFQNGVQNGVQHLEIINGDRLRQIEPHIQGIAALLSPDTAIINPFLYTAALAEHAAANGAVFFLNTDVLSVHKTRPHNPFRVRTNQGIFRCRTLINAAGLFSDRIASMAGDPQYCLYPCRGEYHILDRRAGAYLSMPVYPAPRPDSGGLGVHLTPTMDGNILIGPSNEYQASKTDYGNTAPVMTQLMTEARQLLPTLTENQIIRSYAGLRAKQTSEEQGGYADFIIESSQTVPGLIHLIGIESPGLTASVPIARQTASLVAQHRDLVPKVPGQTQNAGDIPIPARFGELPAEAQRALVEAHPDHGEILCRCEHVTRHEILRALRNPLGVRTLAAVKNRTRAMTGRCQGGYCMTRIVRILHEECHLPITSIRQSGGASWLFTGYAHDLEPH
jgi:glycerol-3-phosphate dehydrogenase